MFESLVTFLDNLPLTKKLSSVLFPYPVGYDFTVCDSTLEITTYIKLSLLENLSTTKEFPILPVMMLSIWRFYFYKSVK